MHFIATKTVTSLMRAWPNMIHTYCVFLNILPYHWNTVIDNCLIQSDINSLQYVHSYMMYYLTAMDDGWATRDFYLLFFSAIIYDFEWYYLIMYNQYFVVCVAITRRCYMNGMSRQQLCFADATLTTDEHPWMSINPLYLTHIYWNNIEYGTCIYHAT